MRTTDDDLQAKPIQTFCNIPKLAKHEHIKTFKIIGNNESQFLLDDQPAFHFEHVWGEGTTGEIYDRFTRPALADLVRGRSTLLFITGRNKKHRNDLLFGETKDTGLLPLSINALYDSIGDHRAMKYHFRSLGNNIYQVQSDAQAMFDRHQRDLLPKVSRNVLGNLTHTSILEKSILDQVSNVSGIDDEHVYTIFVSAMEINSTVSTSTTTDLLKIFTEGLSDRLPKSPHNCVEIEFDDARKTRRKLFHINKIPAKENSTRLFTIRLVQARKSEQLESIVPIVSQLTFIDLPTGRNVVDLNVVKDFIVPPKRKSIESVNHLRDFLHGFPLKDAQKQFVPIKILLCASASNQDASETLQDIRWLMSLQANQYLVYLGREDERQVTRDQDDREHQNLHRPPRPPPFHRPDSNFSQQVPNSTPLAQSTPRSVVQLPTTTTSIESRQSQYQTIINTPIRTVPSHSNHPPPRPTSSSRSVQSNYFDQTPTFVPYSTTPSAALSHFDSNIPPRLPPRSHRTPKTSPTIDHQLLPSTTESKSIMTPSQRRPPPEPPSNRPPILTSTKSRLSRKLTRINSIVETSKRASSIAAPRPSIDVGTSAKQVPLKEEHLVKRSSSADRVGRERWLHHITNAPTVNNAIKLRTSLPNPLQLVSNHSNAMSKLLNATKYAIEHRAENTVQLFQGDVMATSKGGVKVVFTSMDKVTHLSLLPKTCENTVCRN